jgi:hypothetical protein
LLFPYEAILKQNPKKIAIFLILSAKLNTKEEKIGVNRELIGTHPIFKMTYII